MKEAIVLNPLNLTASEIAMTKFIPSLKARLVVPQQEQTYEEWRYTEDQRSFKS
jgi:hypothetical protein